LTQSNEDHCSKQKRNGRKRPPVFKCIAMKKDALSKTSGSRA
jgi:hypothetical protein